MRYFKFIHIFWGNDTKFTPALVEAINDPKGNFEINDHLFVTRYQSLYDYLSGYKNIILDTSKDHILNKYAPLCDCLFCHGLPSNREVFSVKSKYKRKIIARNWGGNRIVKRYTNNYITNIKIFFLNCITKYYFNMRYGSFAAIGIANIVDEIDIRKINKKIPLCLINYENKEINYNWLDIVNNEKSKNKGDAVRILVGHRGTKGENHYNIMKILKKYEPYNIEIYLILSYGDVDYIKTLEKKVRILWPKKVTIIKNFMPIKEYYKFLDSVDVAIFDEERSSALGNICALLSLKKKIFLNENGIIKEGFDKESIPYNTTNEIRDMAYEEFVKPFNYDGCLIGTLYIPFDKMIDKYYSNLHNTFKFAETL